MRRKAHADGRKHCASCDSWIELADFHRNARNWDRLHAYCKACMSRQAAQRYHREKHRLLRQAKLYRQANPEKRKAIALRSKYGLEMAEYLRMEADQGGKCAICRQDGPLHVDHCHATGPVRGLLCMACNTAIGAMGDDPDRLRRAAEYLEKRR